MPSLEAIKTNIFAVDTMFYYTSMSNHQATSKIQNQINFVIPWLHKWRISSNSLKTEAILFANRSPKNLQSIGCTLGPHDIYRPRPIRLTQPPDYN